MDHARLETELQAQSHADSQFRAKRALMRMLVSCQKRQHKSFQEMIAYLLGFPEAVCSHGFVSLNYRPALVEASAVVPCDLCRMPAMHAAAHSATLHNSLEPNPEGGIRIQMNIPH